MMSAPKMILLIVVAAAALAGCAAPKKIEEKKQPERPELTDFQREVRAMKTAKFDYIFVLRRKDGGELTSEDKQFIRDNSHYATNRRSLSKDGKTVFLGSNFEFDPNGLMALKERFEFQDFSKPASELEKKKGRSGENSNASGNEVNSSSGSAAPR